MPSALSLILHLTLTGSPLAAQLRDIHPGPALGSAIDPRLLGLGWLLAALLCALLIGTLVLTLWRQRRWDRQLDWQAADLVPRLQSVLRSAALARWPEARTLQGEAWLAWLDEKGGCRFSELATHWPGWLYGQEVPDAQQRAALRRAYLRWGRSCVSLPQLLARPSRWHRQHGGGTR
ncbi:DUF4381 family protein [Aeromonas tecta]|uniref:DUF4381 family protein n=1 Tax=Aeromonas tecta TaxID=324617 RepID=UPI00067FDFD5|nr:DUF4381 family protein [Aeromonas tecta]